MPHSTGIVVGTLVFDWVEGAEALVVRMVPVAARRPERRGARPEPEAVGRSVVDHSVGRGRLLVGSSRRGSRCCRVDRGGHRQLVVRAAVVDRRRSGAKLTGRRRRLLSQQPA